MASAAFSRRVIARVVASKLVAEPSRQRHWIKALAAYLVEQKRVHEAGLIMNDISHELFVQNGQLLTDITSARPLDDSVRKLLEKLLRDQTGAKDVALTEKTDTSLLGGLIARTSDAELDASVRTKLNRLATIN